MSTTPKVSSGKDDWAPSSCESDSHARKVEYFRAFKNYTPHAVSIVTNDEPPVVIPSAGNARLISTHKEIPKEYSTVCDVPVVGSQLFLGIEGLHVVGEMTPILVSMPVGEYLAANPTMYKGPVYGPDTSPQGVIRDACGNIVGTKRLVLYKPPLAV